MRATNQCDVDVNVYGVDFRRLSRVDQGVTARASRGSQCFLPSGPFCCPFVEHVGLEQAQYAAHLSRTDDIVCRSFSDLERGHGPGKGGRNRGGAGREDEVALLGGAGEGHCLVISQIH